MRMLPLHQLAGRRRGVRLAGEMYVCLLRTAQVLSTLKIDRVRAHRVKIRHLV